jgi:hypothetical protein
MATSTVLKTDTTQSLLCLIPKLIMPDYYYYYFLVCPRDTYKIHMRVPTPNPGLVLESLQTGQRQKRMPPKHCMNLVNKKLNFQADVLPMTRKGQVCEMPTDEA